MRVLAGLLTCAVLLVSCVGPSAAVAPTPSSAATATPTEAAAGATPAPTSTPVPRRYAKIRAFVASETTEQVWVLESERDGPFTVVSKVAVGRLPHQMAVSPDGRFVAVNNRMSASTSIIDPVGLKEIIRIPVGRQPHGITFSVDGKTLFIAHERDSYISMIDTATWKSAPLMVGVPQHVLTIRADRPNELWFTVTNSQEADHLRVIDLETRKVTKLKVDDVHDAYFTPDGSEIWTSSSGFLDKPSDRLVIHDPVARKVKQEIRLTGRYPFHTLKPMQDGMYRLPDAGVMLLSEHIGPSLLWVDWRERRVVGETKLGKQPFHTTYDPEAGRLLVTTNVDGMVNVIDIRTREIVQKVPVTKAHGIVSVGLP